MRPEVVAVLCVLVTAGPLGCGSDERERPKPIPTNPELEAYSKPGTPAPDQADAVVAACAAMLEHEAEGCGNTLGAAGAAGTLGAAVEECGRTWRNNDARGCGAAYARFIECRTNSLDCENGWHPDCDVYEDAAFICTTDFVQRTTCTPLSVDDICEGSTYVYGCVTERKPFPECESAPDTASHAYCCF
ncbi:MAG TPA: hypothetical protein VFU02_08235 [Polyangiaceae bacterium]|nr:hypothetical protein [Polyangiaceae bacterium]